MWKQIKIFLVTSFDASMLCYGFKNCGKNLLNDEVFLFLFFCFVWFVWVCFF